MVLSDAWVCATGTNDVRLRLNAEGVCALEAAFRHPYAKAKAMDGRAPRRHSEGHAHTSVEVAAAALLLKWRHRPVGIVMRKLKLTLVGTCHA